MIVARPNACRSKLLASADSGQVFAERVKKAMFENARLQACP
jgi:hypothetical protein